MDAALEKTYRLSSFCLFYPVGRCGEGGPPRRGGWHRTQRGQGQGGGASSLEGLSIKYQSTS